MAYQSWIDRKTKVSRSALMLSGLVVGGMLFTACGHGPELVTARQTVPTEGDSSDLQHRRILAGNWEYEESGVVVPLVLDAQGNGEYDFKGGRFITGTLTDHSWTGRWAQSENDREGGFEVNLSSDYSAGEGRWWYTRIERDTTPSKSGGRFRLIRVQSFSTPEHTSLRP